MKRFVSKLIIVLYTIPTTLLCSLPVVRYGLAERNSMRNMSGYQGHVKMTYKQMEDRSFVTAWKENGKAYYMFGVFDGNGGYQVSDFLKYNFVHRFKSIQSSLKEMLLRKITKKYTLFPEATETEQRLRNTFSLLEHKINASCDEVIGSMAAVALLEHDDKKNTLYTAHVGDSRIGIKINDAAVFYTQDHTTTNESEVERIEQINPEKLVVGSDGSRVLCSSSYTRVMGKRIDKTLGRCQGLLIAEPEINKFVLRANDTVRMCIASDGLWERIDSELVGHSLSDFYNRNQGFSDPEVDIYQEEPSRRKRYTNYVRQLFKRAYAKIKRLLRKESVNLIPPEETSQETKGLIIQNTDLAIEFDYSLYQRKAGNFILRNKAEELVNAASQDFVRNQGGRFDDTSVILVEIAIPN